MCILGFPSGEPITGQMQLPEILRPGDPPNVRNSFFAPPVGASLAAGPDHSTNFHGMVVSPLDLSHKSTVPRVAITPLGKHAGHFLQGALVCGTALQGTPNVRVDEESADDIRAMSEADVREHLMERIDLRLPVRIFYNAPILPKHSELELLDPRENDERRPARRRPQ